MKVAILGGTGLVGTEMISILAERKFPLTELVVFASPRSEGRKLATPFGEVICRVATSEEDFAGCDFVIIDVDDPIAGELAPMACAAGAKVIDKSAYFRMNPDVPLVIPEINVADIKDVHGVQRERGRGEAHGGVDLEEAAHPGVGEVNFDFFKCVFVLGLDLKAGWIYLKIGAFVAADFLKFLIKVFGVIDVGGAAGELFDVIENFVRRAEASISGFVFTKALKKDLVGVDGDDGVEEAEDFVIMLKEPIKIFGLGLPNGLVSASGAGL